MDKQQIELMPGFQVLEFTPGYTIVRIPSDFTLKIRRAGPFLFDVLDTDELRDPGPFKIKVLLLSKLRPPGVEQEILYDPPTADDNRTIVPPKPDSGNAWDYYQQWLIWNHNRRELEVLRSKHRFNLALLNCVDLIDGPVSVDDDQWLDRLEAYTKKPSNRSERMLLFLKTQVLTTQASADVVRELFTVEEVSIEGLKRAFDNFRRQVEWQEALRDIRGTSTQRGRVQLASMGS